MSSMIRKLMRNASREASGRASCSGAPSLGAVRSGMHQKAEHEYRRTVLTGQVPAQVPEDVTEQPEVPEEAMPAEELTDLLTEEAAEDTAVIEPDAEILEAIAAPDASAEEEASADEPVSETEEAFSVDHSKERIAVPEPVTGGVDCEPRELIYDPGESSPKEISLPEPDQVFAEPFTPELTDPSANVPDAE